MKENNIDSLRKIKNAMDDHSDGLERLATEKLNAEHGETGAFLFALEQFQLQLDFLVDELARERNEEK